MKQLNFIRACAKAGKIVCNILKVLMIVGAVATVFVLMYFSAMPEETMRVEINSEIALELGNNILPQDAREMFEQFFEIDAITETETGVRVSLGSDTQSLSSRHFGISLIAPFVEMILQFLFLHFLSLALRALSEAPRPFTPEIGKLFRNAGIVLIVAELAPGPCAMIVGLITRVNMSVEADLTVVLIGIGLIALGSLFEYGSTLRPVFDAPPSDTPFSDAANPPSDTTTPPTDAPNPPSDSSDHDPNAF